MRFFNKRKNRLTKSLDITPSDTVNDRTRNPHEELAPFARRSSITARKDSPESGSRLSLYIVLALLVGAGFGVWYAVKKTSNVAELTRKGLTNGGGEPAKESEAEVIKKAIADKPAALRQSLSKYAEMSEDIKRILSQRLEAKNIGGAVAVAVTNLQKNSSGGIDSPEQLGFRRIDGDKALVNLAQKGDIDIKTVTVIPVGEHLFKVTVELKNNTKFPAEYVIQKGQLIEIQNAQNAPAGQTVNAAYSTAGLPQTVAVAEDVKGKGGMTVIPPWEPATIEFIAYCANPYLPEPHGPANLAIYALEDTSYETWEGLRKRRIKELNLPPRTSSGSHA